MLLLMDDLETEIKIQEKKEIQQIENDFADIHQIHQDLAIIVNEQHEHLDNIEKSVENIEKYTDNGTNELEKASDYKKKWLPIKLGTTFALIGLIIGGPVGVAAGLKGGVLTATAIGTSLCTGALGTFFGRKLK